MAFRVALRRFGEQKHYMFYIPRSKLSAFGRFYCNPFADLHFYRLYACSIKHPLVLICVRKIQVQDFLDIAENPGCK